MKKRVLCILMAMAVSVGGVSIPAYANEGYGVEEVGVYTENEEVAEESVSSNNVQTVSTNDLEADTTNDVYVADVDELEADEASVETVDIKDVQKIRFQEKSPEVYEYDPAVVKKGNIDCSDGSLTYKVYDNGLRMIIEGNGTLKDNDEFLDLVTSYYGSKYKGYPWNEIQEVRIVGKIRLPKDSSYIFSTSSVKIIGFENIDTNEVTNMKHMFDKYEYDIDVNNFNTSNVKDMSYMFINCKGRITGLDKFNTSNVTDMTEMFHGVKMDNFVYPNFDVSNVENMQDIFSYATINVIDLSSWTLSDSCIAGMLDGATVRVIKLPKIYDNYAYIGMGSGHWDRVVNSDLKKVFPKEKYYRYVMRNETGTSPYYCKVPKEEIDKKKNKNINGVKYEVFKLNSKEVGISKITTDKKVVKIPSKIKMGKKTYKVTYLACISREIKILDTDKNQNIEKIYFPDSIKEIPVALFWYADNLKEVTVGKNVEKIGEQAFYGCKNIKKITFRGKKVKEIGKTAFRKTNKKIVVKAPKSKLKAYKKMIKASR